MKQKAPQSRRLAGLFFGQPAIALTYRHRSLDVYTCFDKNLEPLG